MIKDRVIRLPERPLHLYAEFVSSEMDDEGKTRGSVILHIELENVTNTMPLYFSIPDGEAHPAVICLAEGDEYDTCADKAVFYLKREDALRAAKGIKRKPCARKTSESDMLAWALLRVGEYVASRRDVVGKIAISCKMNPEAARCAALCDERLDTTTL